MTSAAAAPNSTRPRIAVVGAAGFLGRTLVDVAGMRDVSVDTFTRARPCLLANGTLDPRVSDASALVWLVSSINPQIAHDRPDLVAEEQHHLTRFLDAVARLARPPRIVLTSSGGTVYDTAVLPPYAETAQVRPRSAYGIAKLRCEELLLGSALADDAVVTRIANAYGPGQPVASGQGVIAHWLRALRRGEPVRLFGDPHSTRDYVYVDDIADALLAVATADATPPAILNIGSGQPTALGELARRVLETAGHDSDELVVEARRSFDAPHNHLDVTLARRSVGWTPQTDLARGLRLSWEAVRRIGDPHPD